MDKTKMYRVWPSEPVRGFTHTYCITEGAAWDKKRIMDELTGVEWFIDYPAHELAVEHCLSCLEDATIYLSRMGKDDSDEYRMIKEVMAKVLNF